MFNNQMLFDRRMTVRMDRDAEKLEHRGGGGGSSSGLPAGLKGIGMGLGAGGNPLHDVHRKSFAIVLCNNFISIFLSGMSDRAISPDLRSMSSSLGYGSRGMSSGMDLPMSSMPSVSRSAYGGAPLSSSGMGPTGNGSSVLLTDYGSRSSSGYSYSTLGSVGGMGSSSNGGSSALGSSGATYGYSTENLASTRGSTMTGGLSDYDRRDAYDPYVPTGTSSQLQTRDRQPEYRPSTTAYDLGTRMTGLTSMGSTTTSSLMENPMDRNSSRISDTIVINNVSHHLLCNLHFYKL